MPTATSRRWRRAKTVITATSNLDPTVSASCTVVVETVEVTLEGAVQDADGNPMLFTWDLENDSTWTGGTALDTSIMSVTKDPLNNVLYVNDAATNTWAMHKVDPATGESVETAGNSTGVPLWDMEYSAYFSTAEAPLVSSVYYYYFLSPKDPMNLDSMAFDLSGRVNYLTAITSLGYEEYWDEDDQVMLDTEHVLLMDESGTIWHFWIYETDQGMSAWLASYPSNLPELGLTFEGYNNMEAMYCSLIVGEDGNLYLSYFTGDTNQIYQLVFNEEAETYEAALLGDMGNGVWPAALISASSNTSGRRQPGVDPRRCREAGCGTGYHRGAAGGCRRRCGDHECGQPGRQRPEGPDGHLRSRRTGRFSPGRSGWRRPQDRCKPAALGAEGRGNRYRVSGQDCDAVHCCRQRHHQRRVHRGL